MSGNSFRRQRFVFTKRPVRARGVVAKSLLAMALMWLGLGYYFGSSSGPSVRAAPEKTAVSLTAMLPK